MRWRGGRRSRNIEDRRAQPAGVVGAAGAGSLFRLLPLLLRSKFGRIVVGLGLVALLAANFFGYDLTALLRGVSPAAPANIANNQPPIPADQQELGDFVSVVLADTETTWQAIFRHLNRVYKEPKLVLFSGAVSSACGQAGAAMGPFYCPADQKVYIDLSFYRDLKNRHQAPGDFAQAYVIAHEVGHHVQTLLGISQKVHQQKRRLSPQQANYLSVKQELQADCFAGLWAHAANVDRELLERGDLEEALVAAAAIGDDRLQKQSHGYVVPESFTHGSSEQRVRWFKKGFDGGRILHCDTFNAARL